SATWKFNERWKLDAEASANTYGVGTLFQKEFSTDADLSPYRLWLRLSSDRFFLRAGLQKINFGSASILRPLMWFDQLDPRDPLQLTNGVYGVLARYYFLNNANIWLWGLYGNENTRGWDYLGTEKKTPEFGGRIQLPAGPGEVALSYHHRKIGSDSIYNSALMGYMQYPGFEQDRIAIDGKWDLGIGIWFENSLKYNNDFIIPGQKWVGQFTGGADYTFGIGNGLNLKIEHLVWLTGDDLLENFEELNYTAVSANYPFGLFDQVSTIIYYNWKDESWYRFLNWSKQYDNFIFYLMAYWNPETFDIYRNSDQVSLFSGKGFQFMVVFNH
ncbi:MAG: hypothetical protein ACP5E3_12550, partial [Bacteroidales bacterium]